LKKDFNKNQGDKMRRCKNCFYEVELVPPDWYWEENQPYYCKNCHEELHPDETFDLNKIDSNELRFMIANKF